MLLPRHLFTLVKTNNRIEVAPSMKGSLFLEVLKRPCNCQSLQSLTFLKIEQKRSWDMILFSLCAKMRKKVQKKVP